MFKNKEIEYEIVSDDFEFDIENQDISNIAYYQKSKWIIIEYWKYKTLYSCKVRCNECVYIRLLKRFKQKIGE